MTRTALLADEICNHVSSNLTADEWTEYVSDTLAYQTTCPGRGVSPSAR